MFGILKCSSPQITSIDSDFNSIGIFLGVEFNECHSSRTGLLDTDMTHLGKLAE